MSPKKKPLPKFKNEQEEGRWYAQHKEQLDEYFEPIPESESAVPLHVELNLPPRNPAPSKKVPLRIPTVDLERARKLAEKKGIGYQTLLKMIIREGLQREDARL